ncbi:MAG: peptidoglycan-binding protein [Pannonibacter sp.]
MSSWNIRRAGSGGDERSRSGRDRGYDADRGYADPYEDDYEDELPVSRRTGRREAPRDRVERLTRTATAASDYARDEDRYGPEQELDAVADELDRLMGDRQRSRRRDHAEPDARSQRRSERAAPQGEAPRGRRIGAVMEALERLDQRVGDLSDRTQSSRRGGDLRDTRDARGRSGLDDSYGYDEVDDEEAYAAEAPRRRDRADRDLDTRRPSRSHYDGETGRDLPRRSRRRPEDDRDINRAAADLRARRDALDRLAEPDLDALDDYRPDYRPDYREERPRPRRPREADAPSRQIYKDLSRRIDALRKPHEETLDVVRREIGALRETLQAWPDRDRGREDRDRHEMRRLADMVERLRVDRTDDRQAKELRAELADLRHLVSNTNVDGTLKTLEMGYAHIVQRLDELSRSSIDPRAVKSLAARLMEIEDGLSALPRSEHLLVLEGRIGDISERVESLLRAHGRLDIEPLRQELKDVRRIVEQVDFSRVIGGLDDRMRFVADRLDELEMLAREQRGLDSRISAMEERLPDPESFDRLNGRLEEIFGMLSRNPCTSGEDEARFGKVDNRLDEIMDRLAAMERGKGQQQPAMDAAFAGLESRLMGIHSKIESLEERSSRPLSLELGEGAGIEAELLAQLERQVGDLSRRLSEPRDQVSNQDIEALRREIAEMRAAVQMPAPAVVALERRISDLADAVNRGSETLDDRRLDLITDKIGALASQLESAEGRLAGVDGIEKVLLRIEDGLRATRAEVADVASEAARRVVRDHIPETRDYDDAIGDLRDDLKRLLDAAQGTESRTRNTFEGVQSILSGITDRLDSLERSGVSRPAGRPAEPPRDEPRGRAPLPGLPLSAETRDRPKERSRDRKADFIAAARRAAQAASVEVQQARAEEARESNPEQASSGGWLKRAFTRSKTAQADDALELGSEQEIKSAKRSRTAPEEIAAVSREDRPAPEASGGGLLSGGRKRALLFAAAAVILAIGTLQIFRLASGGSEPVAGLDAPDAAAPQVAEAPAEGAAPLPVLELQKKDIVAAPVAGEPAVVAEEQAVVAEAPREPEAAGQGPDVPLTPGPIAGPLAGPSPLVTPQPADAVPPAVAFAPPAISGKFGDTPFVNGGAPVLPSNPATLASAPSSLQPNPVAPVAPGGTLDNLPPEAIGPMALRSAAATGNAAAEFQIGVNYTEGKGVPSDLTEAAKWYEKAAAKGLAPAQYRLASLYEKGRGVPKDIAKAREWYVKAAEAGNAKAMHNLAVLYAEGAEGAPNFTEAARWFKSAAEHGVPDSLFNLGILNARGLGVPKDLAESYKWFAIAAKQGDGEAAKKRDDIANMMDQTQLAAGRLAVDTFKLQEPIPAANTVVLDPAWDHAAGVPATNASVLQGTDMVQQTQGLLKTLGFDPGSVDGQMGPKTRQAIESFQRSAKLPVTGEVTPDLVKALLGRSI